MSVPPVVGSELPTVFDAAVVDTVRMVDGLGKTLDVVDEGVGRSCVRMDSAELWLSLRRMFLTGSEWPGTVDLSCGLGLLVYAT